MSNHKTLRLVNISGHYINITLAAEGGGMVTVGREADSIGQEQLSQESTEEQHFQFSKTDGELMEDFLWSNDAVLRKCKDCPS